MSLILDALRRADAERDRGAVPGLHAQPMPVPSLERRAPGRSSHWAWLAAAVLVLLAAAVVWALLRREPAPVVVAAPATAPPSALAQAAVTPPMPPPATSAAAAAPPGAAALPVREPQPVAEPAPWTSPEPRKATPPAAATPPAGSPSAASAPPTAAAEPVLRREQLPESIRAQLPPLVVGGSIYSPNAADRSLIIDGRLVRENDRLAPELLLQTIGTKSAVLQFKGYRFEIGY